MKVSVSLFKSVPTLEKDIEKQLAPKTLDNWRLFATGMAQSRKEPTKSRSLGHLDRKRGGTRR